MSVLRVTAKTDSGGELHVSTGMPNSVVDATLVFDSRPEARTSDRDRLEWEAFVKRTAGSIADPKFKRAPQGDFQKREPAK